MPYRMKSVGFFIFGDCDIYKLEQACIYTGYEKKGIQRGISPWLWVSNRGEKHPCWHTILLAKSSVLYLLRPLTLERGCPTPDRHFWAAAEQADFVGCRLQKTRNLL